MENNLKFTNLSDGQVETFVLIKSAEVRTNRNGGIYLDLNLESGTEAINAKLWDYDEKLCGKYDVGDFVKVRGILSDYKGKDQLKINRIRKVVAEDNVNLSDFVPSAPYEAEYMWSILINTINSFIDEDFKKLTLTILTKHKKEFCEYPAAYRLHHAIRSGLLMHTLSIVRLAEHICEIYPFINRDMLLCGAMLHDIAKIGEYDVTNTGIAAGYTDKGNLIGHLVLGAIEVEKACEELKIPEKKAMLIEHMIISHHGKPEFGAAMPPKTLEAEMLYMLDTIDSKVYEIHEKIEKLNIDEYTDRLWFLDDRKIFNHGLSDNSKYVDIDK